MLYYIVLKANRIDILAKYSTKLTQSGQAKYKGKLTGKNGQAIYNTKSMAQPSSEIQSQTDENFIGRNIQFTGTFGFLLYFS